MPHLAHSPAADRNKAPILAVLRSHLGQSGTALEIASGTGQHVVWFAASLKGWTWQPTDADAAMLPEISGHCAQAGLGNVLPALHLDVRAPAWPVPTRRFDLIYCANMLHIAPWDACAALMAGASRHLSPAGVLVLYGPYFEGAQAPAPGNLAFDESLRARDPSWGVRRLEDVAAEAGRQGLGLEQRHAMPANNLLLVFRREAAAH